ncbi:MAG: hypothetical protein H7841_11600 [Magnetospirillum sp. WYHS-4]
MAFLLPLPADAQALPGVNCGLIEPVEGDDPLWLVIPLPLIDVSSNVQEVTQLPEQTAIATYLASGLKNKFLGIHKALGIEVDRQNINTYRVHRCWSVFTSADQRDPVRKMKNVVAAGNRQIRESGRERRVFAAARFLSTDTGNFVSTGKMDQLRMSSIQIAVEPTPNKIVDDIYLLWNGREDVGYRAAWLRIYGAFVDSWIGLIEKRRIIGRQTDGTIGRGDFQCNSPEVLDSISRARLLKENIRRGSVEDLVHAEWDNTTKTLFGRDFSNHAYAHGYEIGKTLASTLRQLDELIGLCPTAGEPTNPECVAGEAGEDYQRPVAGCAES